MQHSSLTKRLALTLAGGLTFAVALSGCAATPESSDGRTVLTIQGWKGGGSQPANMEQINAAFEAAHPDIDVQFEFVPANDAYLQKVQPEFLAGNAPDVVMTDVTKIPDWSRAGYLMDLSDQSWVANVDPAALPSIEVGGTVYAQPMESIAEGVYVNLDLLEQAGISEPPTSWPQFQKDLKTLEAAGIDPIALPNKAGDTGQMSLNGVASTLIYQQNPQWDADFLDGDASFTEWGDAVDQLMYLQDEGYVDYKESLGVDEWSQGLTDFASGKYAFWFQGAWNLDAVQEAGATNIAFMPWPASQNDDESSVGIISGTSWSINADAEQPDAAKTYLDFWADPENAAPYLEIEHAISPWVGATNPDDEVSALITEAYNDGRYHFLPRESWLSAEGNKAMKSKIQAYMLGQYSNQEEFLKDLDKALRPSD
ncbi:MAG: ABC transporter substrate-binding protein [Salinibacterium amurskyense]